MRLRVTTSALAALSSKAVHDWPLECRREKAMTLSNLGTFRQEAGRDNAEEPLRSAVALATELASGKQATPKDRRYLAVTRNNLGDALHARGRYEEAGKVCQEAVAGLESLLAENPSAVQDRHFLGYVYEQQGMLFAKMNQTAAAKLAMEKAVARQREAVKLSDGKLPAYRVALASHLTELADLSLSLGDYESVMQSAIELAKVTPDSGKGCFEAAKILAHCAGQLQSDKKIAAPRRDELGRKLLGRTVVMLREALDANAKVAERLKDDPVFKELRDRPEFQTMLGGLVDLGRSGKH